MTWREEGGKNDWKCGNSFKNKSVSVMAHRDCEGKLLSFRAEDVLGVEGSVVRHAVGIPAEAQLVESEHLLSR